MSDEHRKSEELDIDDVLDQSQFLDNKTVRFKDHRKLLRGASLHECLDNVKLLINIMVPEYVAKYNARAINYILDKDAEDIIAYGKMVGALSPGAHRELLEAFRNLKANNYMCTSDDERKLAGDFLLKAMERGSEVASINIDAESHSNVIVNGKTCRITMLYYDILEIIRDMKSRPVGSTGNEDIARCFFELGYKYSILSSARSVLNPDKNERIKRILSDELASSKGKREKKNIPIFTYANPAWENGCQLLHKQMAILIWQGIDDRLTSLDKLAKSLKRVAPRNLIQGGSTPRTVDVCPCPEKKETCPMIKSLQKGKFFDLSSTHMSEVEIKEKKKIEYDSYDDAKNASSRKKKN